MEAKHSFPYHCPSVLSRLFRSIASSSAISSIKACSRAASAWNRCSLRTIASYRRNRLSPSVISSVWVGGWMWGIGAPISLHHAPNGSRAHPQVHAELDCETAEQRQCEVAAHGAERTDNSPFCGARESTHHCFARRGVGVGGAGYCFWVSNRMVRQEGEGWADCRCGLGLALLLRWFWNGGGGGVRLKLNTRASGTEAK